MGLGFLVGILIARHYGPEGYGALSYVVSLGALFGGFASLGFDELLPRDLAAEDQGVSRPTIQKTSMLLRLGAELLVYLLWVLVLLLGEVPEEVRGIGLIYGFYFILQVTDVLEFRLRSDGAFAKMARIRSLSSLTASGVKGLIVAVGAPLEAMALAMLLEYLVAFWLYLAIQSREGWWALGRWSPRYARSVLRRSLFVMVSVFLALFLGRLDILMVEHHLGLEAVGWYAAASRTSELLDAIGIVLSVILIPEFARERANRLIWARAAYLSGFGLFFLAVPALGLIQQFFVSLYGDAYEPAGFLLPLLALKALFNLIAVIRAGLLVADNRTRILPFYALLGLLISGPLYAPLISLMGLKGAVVASLSGLLGAMLVIDGLFFRANLFYLVTSPLALPFLIRKRSALGG